MREIRNEVIFGKARVQMPYYCAERAARWNNHQPYTLDQILRQIFDRNYEEAIRRYMKQKPDAISNEIREKDARDYELTGTGQPRIESSWTQEFEHTAVDIEIPAEIEAYRIQDGSSQDHDRRSGFCPGDPDRLLYLCRGALLSGYSQIYP